MIYHIIYIYICIYIYTYSYIYMSNSSLKKVEGLGYTNMQYFQEIYEGKKKIKDQIKISGNDRGN